MITGKDIFFRCHSFHELCTGTRSNKDALGDTAKAHVMKLFREQVRGTYSQNIETPAMFKGNEMEMHGLLRTFRVNGWGLPFKYTGQTVYDSIGFGTPDEVRIGNDQKCCHTDEQFMKHWFAEEPDKAHKIQAQRYAMLFGRDHWHVSYTLENSPESVVISDAWKLWRKAEGEGAPPESFIDEVRTLHNFDHLPDWARVKTFRVDLTADDEVYLMTRACLGRDYFDELLEKHITASIVQKHQLKEPSIVGINQ